MLKINYLTVLNGNKPRPKNTFVDLEYYSKMARDNIKASGFFQRSDVNQEKIFLVLNSQQDLKGAEYSYDISSMLGDTLTFTEI